MQGLPSINNREPLTLTSLKTLETDRSSKGKIVQWIDGTTILKEHLQSSLSTHCLLLPKDSDQPSSEDLKLPIILRIERLRETIIDIKKSLDSTPAGKYQEALEKTIIILQCRLLNLIQSNLSSLRKFVSTS